MSAENEVEQPQAILVILIIPSHRKNEEEISEKAREKWRRDAQILFAELFGGSTAFEAVQGSFWSSEQEKVLWDFPIVIEAYVSLPDEQRNAAFEVLRDFASKMRAKLDQEEVMLVIDNYTYFLK
ncbi:hypothetical protein LF1_11460 [Rubripirellula obstinata]|uniref:Uncharacterized protein n=1 Tax=Rubripirellula obstinata TaxID=406547 RepID=A0A5B1CHD2_9BACT|nr:hypothetical protein [Rubripirellula obstinata]KAA1258624.1 hypothetical protein LF1_11460 [Rubripirellula obstinata]